MEFVSLFATSKLNLYFSLLILLVVGILPLEVFAHGGEDHGDSKPKTAASDKGTIAQTAKLGKYELMIKYPTLAPDTATAGSIFLTDYATNAAIENADLAVEIESGASSKVKAVVEKSAAPGVYTVKMPALPAGIYTLRASLTYGGETDTATFSGTEISHQAPTATANFNQSTLKIALMIGVFALITASFGALIYFLARPKNLASVEKRAVSV